MACVVPHCSTKLRLAGGDNPSDEAVYFLIPWEDSIQAMRWVNHLVQSGTPKELINKHTHVCVNHTPEMVIKQSDTAELDDPTAVFMTNRKLASPPEDIDTTQKFPAIVGCLKQDVRLSVDAPKTWGSENFADEQSSKSLDPSQMSTSQPYPFNCDPFTPSSVDTVEQSEISNGNADSHSFSPGIPNVEHYNLGFEEDMFVTRSDTVGNDNFSSYIQDTFVSDQHKVLHNQSKKTKKCKMRTKAKNTDAEYLSQNVISVRNLSRETIIVEDKLPSVYTLTDDSYKPVDIEDNDDDVISEYIVGFSHSESNNVQKPSKVRKKKSHKECDTHDASTLSDFYSECSHHSSSKKSTNSKRKPRQNSWNEEYELNGSTTDTVPSGGHNVKIVEPEAEPDFLDSTTSISLQQSGANKRRMNTPDPPDTHNCSKGKKALKLKLISKKSPKSKLNVKTKKSITGFCVGENMGQKSQPVVTRMLLQSPIQRRHPTICSMLAVHGSIMPFPHSPLIPVIEKRTEQDKDPPEAENTAQTVEVAPQEDALGNEGENEHIADPTESIIEEKEPAVKEENLPIIIGAVYSVVEFPPDTGEEQQNEMNVKATVHESMPESHQSSSLKSSSKKKKKQKQKLVKLKHPKKLRPIKPRPNGAQTLTYIAPEEETLADKYMKEWQPTGRFLCKFCSYSSVTCSYLFRHWLYRHSQKFVYQCMYCPAYHHMKTPILLHHRKLHDGKRNMIKVVPVPELAHQVEQEFQNEFFMSLSNPHGEGQPRADSGTTEFLGKVHGGPQTDPWFGASECLPLHEKLQFKLNTRGELLEKRTRTGSVEPEKTNMMEKTSLLDEIYKTEDTKPADVLCNLCLAPRSFVNMEKLFHHWLINHWRIYRYLCTYCRTLFMSKRSIKEHLTSSHKAVSRSVEIQFNHNAQTSFEKLNDLEHDEHFGSSWVMIDRDLEIRFSRSSDSWESCSR